MNADVQRLAVSKHYAHASFEVKEFAESDGRTLITGTATAITPDRYGDVVHSLGARFKLPLSALWQHNSLLPVGNVVKAEVFADRIDAVMELPRPTESAALIERYKEAVESVKLKLVRGLSIGFRPLGPDSFDFDMDTYTFNFKEWEWLELSLVTIPAHAEATIDNIRKIDTARRALAPLGRTICPKGGVVTLNADDLRRASRRKDVIYL